MAAEYYYLVAGLPDLIQGTPKKGLLYETLLDEIRYELSDEDNEILSNLMLRYDCENLLNIINKKDEFDNRGLYAKEDLVNEISSPETLPQFMVEFLEAQKDGRDLYPGLGQKEQLLAGYFIQGMNHSNKFIKEWVTFELNLGNIVAANSARKIGLPVEKSVIPLNDSAEKIAKSSASDFGVGGEFNWLDTVLSNFDDPNKLEMTLDEVRWQVADELSEEYYFTVEAILAFTVKLNSVARWSALSPEYGSQKIEQLLDSMRNEASVAQEKN